MIKNHFSAGKKLGSNTYGEKASMPLSLMNRGQREALEELGHDILIKKYIGNAEKYYITQQDQTPMIADSYFYLAELAEWKLDPIEEDHELEWIPISEAQELLHHEHQAWAVDQAFEPK
ncbi:hypothetical protein [Fictibacillus sp. FJAT-27399]|uniref:hypothetical protein n=1 Tax=Fictibacillus sp. FJAT-27399 TaxID=1729689 RepID=UPI000784879C|nr:hypothetical protein [Fictibacillus sp. FJAT-27399]